LERERLFKSVPERPKPGEKKHLGKEGPTPSVVGKRTKCGGKEAKPS